MGGRMSRRGRVTVVAIGVVVAFVGVSATSMVSASAKGRDGSDGLRAMAQGGGGDRSAVADKWSDDESTHEGVTGTRAMPGHGRPADGSVGRADDKSPKGQWRSDDNSGYECDDNEGVGDGNPAHIGCKPDATPETKTVTKKVTVVRVEHPKKEEPKAEEPKKDEAKPAVADKEAKKAEPKKHEAKKDHPKKDEAKKPEPKKPEPKKDDKPKVQQKELANTGASVGPWSLTGTILLLMGAAFLGAGRVWRVEGLHIR